MPLMKPGDVAVTPCPCCKGELYRRVFVDPRGVWAFVGDLPPIQHDNKGGHFMKCPHCSKRVEMVHVEVPPAGVGWDLAPVQRCDQTLP